MKLQADVLGCDVVRPENVEASALGVAYFAGLASGFWPDRSKLPPFDANAERFTPAPATDATARHIARWHLAVERSRNWATH